LQSSALIFISIAGIVPPSSILQCVACMSDRVSCKPQVLAGDKLEGANFCYNSRADDCAGRVCDDGPGTATFIEFNGPDVTCVADGSPHCMESIFGLNCIAYNGTIGIWFGTDIHELTSQVLQGHLSRLGLDRITHILEDLTLMMPPGGGEASTLVMSFFEDLMYIGGNLTVDVNSIGTALPPVTRHFKLSSLHKLSHIGGNLILRNTRLPDLSTFGTLTCVGRALRLSTSTEMSTTCFSDKCHADGQIVLSGNAELLSYNGLDLLTSVTRSITDIDASALMDISALTRLGRCTDGAKINTRVGISVAACPEVIMTTSAHVCQYISSKKCLPLNPPYAGPPSSPSPPPVPPPAVPSPRITPPRCGPRSWPKSEYLR
jgi:hypothetical protein